MELGLIVIHMQLKTMSFVVKRVYNNEIPMNPIKYKCPRCGHITRSHSTGVHSHSSRKCGAVGCTRSLSRRHQVG